MDNKDEYINSLLLSLFLTQGEIDRLNQTLDLARKGELVYINNPQNAALKAENEKLRELLNHYQEEAEALRSYETYKIWLNNEYKKENDTLKSQLDFEVQKKEVLETENDRLKEELTTYGATGVCEVCSDKANKLADKYLGCLQEIKAIANNYIKGCVDCSLIAEPYECEDCTDGGMAKLSKKIIDLITKAESEG